MNTTSQWLVRLLLLFPFTGAAAGATICFLIDFVPLFGAVCGSVEGAVFGAMIVWPTRTIPFWRIAIFTASGTVLLGTSGIWAWNGYLLSAIYLSPVGFWIGFAALILFEMGLRQRRPALNGTES